MGGNLLQRQYKKKLSSFAEWPQRGNAEDYILNPKNISPHLALDETALTNGELYTVLSNKSAKGKKGSIVAMVKGTLSADVIDALMKIPKPGRNKVAEISLDMASSMNLIAKTCFPKASITTDRFHAQKLAFEAVQEIRAKHRWEEIENENNLYQQAKTENKTFNPKILSNGDTPKQLLARSRYLLFKAPGKWTENQKQRAEVLFQEYSDIKRAYYLSNSLRAIYNQNLDKAVALTKMAR